MPDTDGRFRAEVLDVGVALTGTHNLTTVTLRLRLVEQLDGTEWIDCRGYGWEINAYNYLEKKYPPGALNHRTIEALKTAFGWPGDDPFWFEDEAGNLPGCQVSLKWEEYEGRSRLKVAWIDPWDAELGGGGVLRSDEAMRQAIRARLGSKLRANAGPTPQMPLPPRPKPAKTDADVWAWWCQHAEAHGLPEDQRNALWINALEAVCDDPFGTSLTAQDVERLEEELRKIIGSG